jgi:hypothetical protein
MGAGASNSDPLIESCLGESTTDTQEHAGTGRDEDFDQS